MISADDTPRAPQDSDAGYDLDRDSSGTPFSQGEPDGGNASAAWLPLEVTVIRLCTILAVRLGY